MRKGQISVEYLIITGIILLAFIVPAAIFLSSFTRSSLNGGIQNQQANELGEVITETAKQTYYLGLYAKRRVTVTVPENVQRVYTLKITPPSGIPEYNLVLITDDANTIRKHIFLSKAPIVVEGGSAALQPDIPDCLLPGNSCVFSTFPDSMIKPGKRAIELETLPLAGDIVVRLSVYP